MKFHEFNLWKESTRVFSREKLFSEEDVKGNSSMTFKFTPIGRTEIER